MDLPEAVEPLRFTIQPVRVVLDNPVARFKGATLGDLAVYLKWQCGKAKFKQRHVRCTAATTRITKDGKVAVSVTDAGVFDFVVHFQIDEHDRASLRRETISVELILLVLGPTNDEKARDIVHRSEYDLRDLVDGSRLGDQRERVFQYGPAGQAITVCFAVTRSADFADLNPTALSQTDAPPKTALSPAAMQDVSAPLFRQSESAPLFERLRRLSCGAGCHVERAETAFEAMRALLPHLSSSTIAPARTMIADGESRCVHLGAMPLPVAFDILFSDNAPFSSFMHKERRNKHFCDHPWKFEGDGAVKRVAYSARFGKDSYQPCDETSMLACMCAPDGAEEFFRLSLIDAPGSPLGDGVRLQLLVRARADGEGTSVMFVAFARFSSSIVKRAFGSVAQKQLSKLLTAAEAALQTLSTSAGRQENTASTAAAGTAAPAAPTLRRDLWDRLGDDVAVSPHVAAHYLRYLLDSSATISSTPAPAGGAAMAGMDSKLRERLRSLEQVVIRFREDTKVVELAAAHLHRIMMYCGSDHFVKLRPSIQAALEQVDRPPPLVQAMLQELRHAAERSFRDKMNRIRALPDPFAALGDPDVITDERLIGFTFARVLERVDAMRHFSYEEVSMLAKAIALNLQHPAIVTQGLRVIETVRERRVFREHVELVQVLETILHMSPTCAVAFKTTLNDVMPSDGLSAFDRMYGHFVRQKPTFEAAAVRLGGPGGSKSTMLYVTQTFICVDGEAIAREDVVRVELGRSALIKPAITLTWKSSGGSGEHTHTVAVSTWARSGFLQAANLAAS